METLVKLSFDINFTEKEYKIIGDVAYEKLSFFKREKLNCELYDPENNSMC